MTIFVKPKNGILIKRPDNGRFLKPEGETVPKNSFWRRRLNDGDVLETRASEPVKAAPKHAQKTGGKE